MGNGMVDREKVIKGLECCTQPGSDCAADCPYTNARHVWMTCTDVLMTDALALLKEQEPVEPKLDEVRVFRCAKCNHPVGYKDVNGITFPHCFFCFKCGQAVKWNG